ncbi:MAG: hypothetical protein Q4A17_05130 [Thermoguttaceae bacterium]|nr:hypothetical protein [Thermoguttaceae bacterium]
MNFYRRFSFIFALLAFFSLSAQHVLGALDGQNVGVSVGIPAADGASAGKTLAVGVWKPGRQVPFRVTLNPSQSGGDLEPFRGRIELEIPDSDGIPVRSVTSFSGVLPATVELPARFGHSRGEYRLKIFEEAETEADAPGKAKLVHESEGLVEEALPETKNVFLVVGPTDAGLEACVAQMACPADRKPKVVRVSSAAELPQKISLWELVDVLVVTTDDESVLNSWSGEQTAALESWARLGGTVVLSVGKNAQKWADLPQWKAFQPGKLEKVLPVRETAALELFAQSPIPITLLGVSEKYRIPVAKFTEFPDPLNVRAEQFDLPLVLRRNLELGTVHWLTFDLDHPALVKWEGRGNLLASTLGFAERSNDFHEKKNRGMALGYDDISGQLRSALDDFEGLKPVSFALLTLFFLIYLGIIGPGSWFLCKKLPRGGEAASWTLFLVVSLGGAFLLWTLAGTHGGVRLNQVQVVDYVQETGSVRQSLWGNVWSPMASRLDLDLEPLPEDVISDENAPFRQPSHQIHWFGLPGAYLGGMDSQLLTSVSGSSSGLALTEGSDSAADLGAFCLETDGKLKNVPFFARSTKSFCASQTFQLKPDARPVFGTLRDVNHSRVVGEVQNPLSVPLEHCIVFCGGWAYEVGKLAPGETFTIDDSTPYFATSILLVDADYIEDHSIKNSVGVRRVNRPYSPSSHDLRYIMRTILFYGKAGGRAYTTLNDSYLKNLDASELLNSRTAILLGFTESAPAPLFTGFQIPGKELKDPRDKRVNVIRACIEVR